MYHPENHCYDMTYECAKYTTRPEIRKEQGKIACTCLDDNINKWVISEITETTFHWQNVTVLDNGEQKINCEVFAQRVQR